MPRRMPKIALDGGTVQLMVDTLQAIGNFAGGVEKQAAAVEASIDTMVNAAVKTGSVRESERESVLIDLKANPNKAVDFCTRMMSTPPAMGSAEKKAFDNSSQLKSSDEFYFSRMGVVR